MPKLYEYLGIIIQFYSNEHTPIHIHAIDGKNVMKVSFIIENEEITKIIYEPSKGNFTKTADLKKFIETFKYKIVYAWIDYFVLHKHIKNTKITKKL